MDQNNQQKDDKVQGGGLPPMSGAEPVVSPTEIKPEVKQETTKKAGEMGEPLPPLETAEDDTFTEKKKEEKEEVLPPLPGNEKSAVAENVGGSENLASVTENEGLKEIKEIKEVNSGGEETPPPTPPETVPVVPGKSEEKQVEAVGLNDASQGIDMGDGGEKKDKKGGKKVNKKTVVGGIVALLLLVGVPVLALNLGYFRGDVRERAYLLEDPDIETVACPSGTSDYGSGVNCATRCSGDCVGPEGRCCELSAPTSTPTSTPTPTCDGAGGECVNTSAAQYQGNQVGCKNRNDLNSSCPVGQSCVVCGTSTFLPAATCTSVEGGKCYTAATARYQAQVDGCTNRTDLTCPEDGYACVVCEASTKKDPTTKTVYCNKDCVPLSECVSGTQVGGVAYGDCGAGEYCCEKKDTTPAWTPPDRCIEKGECLQPGTLCCSGLTQDFDLSCPVTETRCVEGGGSVNPPSAGVCLAVKIYTLQDGVWTVTPVAEVGQHVEVGDSVRLALKGNSSAFVSGRFRIVNNGVPESLKSTAKKNAGGELYFDYEIKNAGSYSVEGEIRK